MARRDEIHDEIHEDETVEIRREAGTAAPPGPAPPGTPGAPLGEPELEQAVVQEHETIRPLADGAIERDVVRHEQRRRMTGDRLAWILLLLVLLAAAAAGAWWYATQQDTRDVPAVEGLAEAEAIARVEERNLDADVTRAPSDAPEGTVFAQDPAAGSDVDEGSTVRLSVSGGPEQSPVPNAVGMTEAVARDRLVAAGFEVQTREVFSEDEPGTVVAQEPAAGARAAEGSPVAINVSKGTGEVEVPDVVGLGRAEAEAELESAGLDANVVEVPSVEPEGTVVAQSPAGGTARKGSSVRVNVSNGTLPE